MAEMMPSNLSKQEIEQLVRGAVSAMQKGDLEGARAVAAKGIEAGLEHAFLLKVEALWLHGQGRLQEALRTFHHARTLTPNDPSILNGIAACLAGMGETDAALKMVDASLELAPSASPTHYLRGWILETARSFLAAAESYRRTISISPNHVQALSGLASVAIYLGDFAEARARAAQALALDSRQPTAILAMARAEIEQGEALAAEAQLRDLFTANPPESARPLAWTALGDALDAQDRTAEAFAAWTERGEELRRKQASAMAESPKAADILAPVAAHLAAMPGENWRRRESLHASDGSPRTHVFLLGFLRSGTTLLEQVLAVHPDVLCLEERGALKELALEYVASPSALDRLATLEGEASDEARALYWQRARRGGLEPRDRVVIDKDPLNTVNLPLIAKLFPDAKVVFALRDPRDVVLSCYRRWFDVQPVRSEFLTVESCGQFYAAVMNMGEICRARLPLTLIEHRYEDMIDDFENRVRTVCEFLGIEWTDAMRDFSERARGQEIGATLSANQVRRPLYREAVGAWRRYAEQLAPALPLLEPWLRRFGYPEA